VYHSIFPIDLSKTHTRLMLQFPTLYCLFRMCLLWCLIILQTSGTYPETFPSWMPGQIATTLQKLGYWASRKPMDEVCWISFCSLSLAYFVESFVRKLDELANGTMEEVHLGRQMSPYNLVRSITIRPSPLSRAYWPTRNRSHILSSFTYSHYRPLTCTNPTASPPDQTHTL
jgi:hypothetical protein